MATPAATLQILVDANTRSATSALTRFDSKLRAVDKTSVSATTRTSALGKASKTAGGHLASAAKYAAGAAVAYLSISQAKAAVTTTQELAKATLGLQKNLGLAGREAGQWAAAASSRGVATTKLGMGFKTLATQVEAARGGSAAALEMFEKLGIGMADLNKGSKDVQGLMFQIADGMDSAGAGTERMATVSKLFGRSYAGIAPLIRDGSTALKENLAQTEKYGAALHGQTLADQEKLRSSLIESNTAWLGLKVTFTEAITPAITEVSESFQKVSRIMADNKLTDAAKFEKVGKIIGQWADKALDAFVAVLPQIISRAGEAAPKIAAAFVKGFMNAPILGQLFLGGWLLSKIGGLGAIGGLGKKAGSRFGGGFTSGFGGVASVATTLGLILAPLDKGSKEIREMGDAFGSLDKAMKALSGSDFTETSAKSITNLTRAFRELHKEIPEATLDISPALSQLEDRYGSLVTAGARMSKAQREAFKAMALEARQQGTITAEQLMKVNDAMDHSKSKWEANMRAVADATGESTKRVKAAVGDMTVKVSKQYAGMVEVTGAGLQILTSNTSAALKSLGVKTGPEWKLQHAQQTGGGYGNQALQKGGVLVPGYGTGDKVPAMLEPGEVVINRKAVAAMGGANKANAINKMIPRFASGGWVDPAGPGTGVVNPAIAKVVGAWSQRYNAAINYGFDPGGGHLSPGHNITGTATDTGPAAGWGAAPTKLFETGLRAIVGKVDQILYGSHGVGTPYPNHGWGNHAHIEWGMHPDVQGAIQAKIARVILNGPDGPLKSMGQKALDTVRSAAKKFLGRKAGMSGGPDTVSQGAYKGPLDKVFPHPTTLANPGIALSAAQVSGLASKAGLNGSTFEKIAHGESGYHPGIVGNDPGGTHGYGLWQITSGFNDDIIDRFGGVTQMFNPWVNAQAAKAIFDRQGIGAWYGTQFLAGGGIAGGQMTYSPRGPSPELMDKIHKLARQTTTLNEKVANAQAYDALSTSPMGGELSDLERAGQVALADQLVANLSERASTVKKALRKAGVRWKGRGRLQGQLNDLTGITGEGGLLLQAKVARDSLNAVGDIPGTDNLAERLALTQSLLSASNLRYGVSQAQYGVLGGMQSGGVIPNADVKVWIDSAGNAQVAVNGEMQNPQTIVQKGSRGYGRRPLPSSKGF